jgi:chromosome segregation ATPase
MEDPSVLNEADARWSEEFARALASQRERVREYLGSFRRRQEEVGGELNQQVAQVAEGLARERTELSERQAELGSGLAQLEANQAKLRQDERGLTQHKSELESDSEELARQRKRVQEKLAELDAQREALETEERETKTQRRRIAQEFTKQRQAHLKELDERRDELKNIQGRLGDVEPLAGELDGLRHQHARLERQLADMTAERDELSVRLESAAGQEAGSGEADAALREECDRLRGQLAEAREQVAAGGPAGGEGGSEELADMQRRYELALEDLRDLKKRNAELEKRSASAPQAAGGGETMDWEAQKRRMLAALESGGEGEDESQRDERLKIKEVLQKTEAVVASKDEEIAELKQRLEEQSSTSGSASAGAAAVAELFSQDEVLKKERERLQALQREWEDKLRQAEIDLSVQRAKIARERAEVEERLRVLAEQTARGEEAVDTGDGRGKKPPRGRWLTRLGLKEQDE